MRTPPESYLIFKEELKKAEAEKIKLKEVYESKVHEMNKELSYLKEQISSQQDMMKTTLEYAAKLELELDNLRQKIKQDQQNAKKSFH
jgi:regulator of replication initiation timing